MQNPTDINPDHNRRDWKALTLAIIVLTLTATAILHAV